ncbi:MAG: N-acetylmuramoyl-L-alanine amidase [Lachnospiraceae bacterium]|nr:N-acetylmuramoyl-L-alanine amidase [Lachnospiraceae bacterium]
MRLVDGKCPDGDVLSEGTGERITGERITGVQVIEELSEGMEVSLSIPLDENTDVNEIQVEDDPMSYRVNISIPTKEQNFYYKNELSGSQKGITGIVYNYNDRMARFEVNTDGYYISSVYFKDDMLNLVLETPKEKYGHVYVLDPVCGGEENGSSAYGVLEKDITLKVSEAVMKSAETVEDEGFFATRREDKDVSEEDRVGYNTILKPDIFIRLRVNADSDTRMTNGISATAGSPALKEVAEVMIAAIAAETGQVNKGVTLKGDAAGVETNGIEIELGYITNKAEALNMSSDEYAAKFGQVMYYLLSDTEEAEKTQN